MLASACVATLVKPARAWRRRAAVTSVAGVIGCAAAPRTCPQTAAVPPRIECTYPTGGDSTTLRIDAAPDPYRVPELPAGDRFAIKFVYVAAPPELASLRVYAFQMTDGGPQIVNEAQYVPPFAPGRAGFTGRQLVYDARGGELAYTCAWLDR